MLSRPELADRRCLPRYQALTRGLFRQLLATSPAGQFDEQALPSYAHHNPLARWLFWRRVVKVLGQVERCLKPADRVLDFGCGPGVLIPLLDARGLAVTACDLEFAAADFFLGQFGLAHLPRVHGGDLGALAPASFDAVLALDVLEHVPDLEGTIALLLRALKPGGTLLISGPTENLFYKIGRWVAGFDGHYHVRDIRTIAQAVRQQAPLRRFALLYPGMPLFDLFEARRAA